MFLVTSKSAYLRSLGGLPLDVDSQVSEADKAVGTRETAQLDRQAAKTKVARRARPIWLYRLEVELGLPAGLELRAELCLQLWVRESMG